jgi:hypothetical protein
MTAEQATLFLTALRCKQIKVKDNGWVEAACPLAPWLHPTGKDNNPSFGVVVNDGGSSNFSCFTCTKGTAEELVQMLTLYAKNSLGDYDIAGAHHILDSEVKLMPLPEFQEFQGGAKHFEEWPQWWLDSFPAAYSFPDVLQYLTGRGVTLEQSKQHDLKFDFKRMMIVCPYRNVFGRLAGARGRSILAGVEGHQKHYDYTVAGRNNCKLTWYNEQVLNLPGPVVVVEGQFDCWRTLLGYPKVIANLTAKPSWEKMQKLTDCGSMIQIPDNDGVQGAGAQSIGVYREFCAMLHIKHRVLSLPLPDGAQKIDPAECHPDWLHDRIQEML